VGSPTPSSSHPSYSAPPPRRTGAEGWRADGSTSWSSHRVRWGRVAAVPGVAAGDTTQDVGDQSVGEGGFQGLVGQEEALTAGAPQLVDRPGWAPADRFPRGTVRDVSAGVQSALHRLLACEGSPTAARTTPSTALSQPTSSRTANRSPGPTATPLARETTMHTRLRRRPRLEAGAPHRPPPAELRGLGMGPPRCHPGLPDQRPRHPTTAALR